MGRIVRRLVAISLLLLATMGGVGCSVAPASRWVVVVLFDITWSTQAAAVRARYGVEFHEVLDAVAAQGGLVLAYAIGPRSLADPNTPIRVEFPVPRPLDPVTEEWRQHERDVQNIEAIALGKVRRLLAAQQATRGSAIMASLVRAGEVFTSYSTARTRTLVVLSDGMEVSSLADFNREKLTPDRIQLLQAHARQAGMLASLKDVEVYWSGAGLGASGEASDARFVAIRQYWTSWVTACGGHLPVGRYAAALVRFP